MDEISPEGEIIKGNRDVQDLDPLKQEDAFSKKKKKRKPLKEQLKDPIYKKKLINSLCISLVFLTLGMCIGMHGPTFLDLQIITNTDVERGAAFFTAGSIGYFIGSVATGAVYNYVSQSLLLFIGSTFLGVVCCITPYCSPYALMIFIRGAGGVACGFVDTTGNANHMQIWGNEGQVLMQLLHFCFALGGTISPLYTEPFLAPKEDEENSSTVSLNMITVTTVGPLNASSSGYGILPPSRNSSQNFNLTSPSVGTERTTHVAYAFLITGILCVASAIPFLVIYVKEKLKEKKKGKTAEETLTQRDLPRPVLVFVLVTVCAFYLVYCSVEDTFASFLMTFLVKQYDFVSKSKGAYITAFYWASFAVSRFLMIFLSKILSPVKLLTLCCSLMVVSFAGFYISATFSAIKALTFFAVLAGFSMSAVFPSGFSWTEQELLRVTGRVSSCILLSACLGTMANPMLLAYLMEEFSNMWFCYLLVNQTVLLCVLFIFLLIFNRCYLNVRYGKLQMTPDITIDVELEINQPLSSENLGKVQNCVDPLDEKIR
ncbi:sodium-dependent glucose transporter 1A [Aplysia californica]|uniref:Sodium-dependent glucose transporter 1A n=1 Tax=Aplysia californica TaxID=6500 RepID=A0ABM1VY27_APLCA|nr:sodium-dependent glucose transporter 1A [Aplysia californica]XP_005104821.1 sodium-dependent glucose transporter 1A [Aplysia californica]XP_035827320.1 sodium-dependent glucose transporter 1A [Aplysia californica]